MDAKFSFFPREAADNENDDRPSAIFRAGPAKKSQDSVAMFKNLLYNLQSFRSCKVTSSFLQACCSLKIYSR
jgi:hypothetical protein